MRKKTIVNRLTKAGVVFQHDKGAIGFSGQATKQQIVDLLGEPTERPTDYSQGGQPRPYDLWEHWHNDSRTFGDRVRVSRHDDGAILVW